MYTHRLSCVYRIEGLKKCFWIVAAEPSPWNVSRHHLDDVDRGS